MDPWRSTPTQTSGPVYPRSNATMTATPTTPTSRTERVIHFGQVRESFGSGGICCCSEVSGT